MGVSDPSKKGRSPEIFVVIPVKKLDEAKSRLSPLLTIEERKDFCLKMLEDVLISVKSTEAISQTVVISKDPLVRQAAKTFEAVFLKEKKTGMNQAVSQAIDWCIQKAAKSVLILPADIPLIVPSDLHKILSSREKVSIVISPSRSGEGTNALLLTPPEVSPTFYGPGSFQRHFEEAKKRELSFRILRSSRIAFDIDTVNDLKDFVLLNAKESSAYKLLNNTGLLNKLGIRSNEL